MSWERVRQLFQAAIEQPAESRTTFLLSACGGDEELRREVWSLLAAHTAASGFLEIPAVRLDDDRPAGGETLALEPGIRVGNFEVVAPLGSGGMGEVYRARDSRLARDVAIKLLPPAFAADAQRLARFERESRILASLNHPNIASIHSIEHIDGLHLLVLELVEGPTLADQLKSGPVPVADALAIARQLADALDAAHERGIVHRDLKPANVKLSPTGRVMLLDFGLAKERAPFEAGFPAKADAETCTSTSLILGTFAYMSPEQARGQPVDKRADIWAFGCILFELLSGQRAFPGATSSDTIAAVLERQPDWSVLPDALPASLRPLLRRCLEKDAHRRLHDIADARIEIEDAQQPLDARPNRSAWSGIRGARSVFAGAAILMAGLIALGWSVRETDSGGSSGVPMTRFTWPIPASTRLESPAIVSPDGRHIAFTAIVDGGPPRLYVRALSALDAEAIPRTEGAMQPFWSPDSRALAYFARGKLLRVAIDGGAPVEICAAANPRGGTWGRSGVIVFQPGSIYSGLSRVSAEGGPAEPVTLLDSTHGENAHRWPVFLPDGRHFIYFVRSIVAERRGVYLGRIDRPASIPGAALFRSESEAVYAPLDSRDRGVLLNVAEGHIEAHPFDTHRYTVTGEPTILPLPVGGNTPHHASMLSVSADVLTHVSSSLPYGQRLVSSTRTGEYRQLDASPAITGWPRLSPDGTRIVRQRVDAITGSPDLWVENIERGTRIRLTEEGASGQLPVWSPDGTRVAYVAGSFQRPVVTITSADGTGVIATLQCPKLRCEPSDWSSDGQWLVVTALEKTDADVWMLSTTGGTPQPLLTEPFVERDARLSADGHLMAYVSEEVGRPEISVRTVVGTPRREVVSVGGGTQPVWGRDGRELLFVDPDGSLRSAAVRRTDDGRPVVGSITRVGVPLIGTGHYGTQFDLSSDGRSVYFLDRQPGEAPREIGVVLGWRELVNRLNGSSRR